jgi:hypothetical protein
MMVTIIMIMMMMCSQDFAGGGRMIKSSFVPNKVVVGGTIVE